MPTQLTYAIWTQALLLLASGMCRGISSAADDIDSWQRGADARCAMLALSAAGLCILSMPARGAKTSRGQCEAFAAANIAVQMFVAYAAGSGIPGTSLCREGVAGGFASAFALAAALAAPYMVVHGEPRIVGLPTFAARTAQACGFVACAALWSCALWRAWPAAFAEPGASAVAASARASAGVPLIGDADLIAWTNDAVSRARSAGAATVAITLAAAISGTAHGIAWGIGVSVHFPERAARADAIARACSAAAGTLAGLASGSVAEICGVSYALRTSTASTPFPAFQGYVPGPFENAAGVAVQGQGWESSRQTGLLIALAGAAQALYARGGISWTFL